MGRKKLLALIIGFVLAAAPLCVSHGQERYHQDGLEQGIPRDIQGIISEKYSDEISAIFKQCKTVGGAIAIAYKGEIIYEQYYGYANKAHKQPVTEKTYFRMASVTKMITGIGVMQLVQEGLLDLDANISEYLGYEIQHPKYKNTPITLRQLMTHTSAISMGGGYSSLSKSLHDMLSKEANRPANFTKYEPGTNYAYSNFGTGIMGSLIEAVTGLSIDQYIKLNVFGPLGIDGGYHPTTLQSPEEAASIYQNGKIFKANSAYLREHYDDTPNPEMHFRITKGDLWMRASDIAKLLSVLCNDGSYQNIRLLQPETVQGMRLDQSQLGGSVTGYSPYGLCIERVNTLISDRTVYGHQGRNGQTIANAYFDPEINLCFVVITNGASQTQTNRISVLGRKMAGVAYGIYEMIGGE